MYTEFQSDSIRFLDIITSIDGTTVSEVTMGNCYSMIADNTEVTLDLLQIGLPPMSRVLANGELKISTELFLLMLTVTSRENACDSHTVYKL